MPFDPSMLSGPPQQFNPNPLAGTQGIVDTLDPTGQYGVNAVAPQPPLQRGLSGEENGALAYLDGVNELFQACETAIPALAPAIGQARQILIQATQMYLQTGSGTPGSPPPFSPNGSGGFSNGPAPSFGGGMEGEGPENIPLPTL